MSKILDLAKKLKALATSGVDGEKNNADLKLKELMKKHRLTEADIEDEEVRTYRIKYRKEQQKILIQVIAMILGAKTKLESTNDERLIFFMECTPAQYLEIQGAFEFYWEAYVKEFKIFETAFIIKNNLVPTDVEGDEMDPEELIRLKRMMAGIDQFTMYKQLKK